MGKCEKQMNAGPVEMLRRGNLAGKDAGGRYVAYVICARRMNALIHVHVVLVFFLQAKTVLPVVVPELRLAMTTAVGSASARLYAWA